MVQFFEARPVLFLTLFTFSPVSSLLAHGISVDWSSTRLHWLRSGRAADRSCAALTALCRSLGRNRQGARGSLEHFIAGNRAQTTMLVCLFLDGFL